HRRRAGGEAARRLLQQVAGGAALYDRLTIAGKQAVWAWAFLAVPVAFFLLVRLWPAAQGFWLSFNSWNLLGAKHFVGLANYARLGGDPVFWKATWNSFSYVAL